MIKLKFEKRLTPDTPSTAKKLFRMLLLSVINPGTVFNPCTNLETLLCEHFEPLTEYSTELYCAFCLFSSHNPSVYKKNVSVTLNDKYFYFVVLCTAIILERPKPGVTGPTSWYWDRFKTVGSGVSFHLLANFLKATPPK